MLETILAQNSILKALPSRLEKHDKLLQFSFGNEQVNLKRHQ